MLAKLYFAAGSTASTMGDVCSVIGDVWHRSGEGYYQLGTYLKDKAQKRANKKAHAESKRLDDITHKLINETGHSLN